MIITDFPTRLKHSDLNLWNNLARTLLKKGTIYHNKRPYKQTNGPAVFIFPLHCLSGRKTIQHIQNDVGESIYRVHVLKYLFILRFIWFRTSCMVCVLLWQCIQSDIRLKCLFLVQFRRLFSDKEINTYPYAKYVRFRQWFWHYCYTVRFEIRKSVAIIPCSNKKWVHLEIIQNFSCKIATTHNLYLTIYTTF